MSAPYRILLAGDGREFDDRVLAHAAELARRNDGVVCLIQLLRVWGTGLGLPHPGLLPNRQEKEAALASVHRAERYLERRRVPLDARRITATRRPARAILREAGAVGADVIVMGRGRPRGRVGRLLWTDDPRTVARRAAVPVRLVPEA